MSTFALALLDNRGAERFDAVRQFIAADASGSFGVLAGHARMVAVLRYGLARFEDAQGRWRYLALPGGILHFADNRLTLTTVSYFLGERRDVLLDQLAAEMARADSEIAVAQATLTQIEQTLLRRLVELTGRAAGGVAA